MAHLVTARRQLTLARNDLVVARNAVTQRDDATSRQAFDRAAARLRSAGRSARALPLSLVAPVPLAGSAVRAVEAASDAGLQVTAGGRVILDAASTLPSSGQNGIEGQDLSPFHVAATKSLAAVAEADRYVANAYRILGGPAGAVLPIVSGPAKDLRKEVARTRHRLDGARRGLETLTELSDPTTETKLLLLSQDTLELRPTGGYIGSFGIIHFSHGTVRLEGYREVESLPPPSPPLSAPADLAAYLPSFWGLSNVNWWPNFPTTAAAAADMFKRQGGGDVDGVIALTELTIARLVGVLGPVQVPGYAQPIVEQGFNQRVVYEVELKQPLDNPRKKFLTELANALFEKMSHLPSDRVPAVAQALARSAGAGDVQMWFADPARQRRVDGTVLSGRLPATNGDFVMLVDANLSASKANLGLVKTATYRVQRKGNGGLRSHLEITVRNQGERTRVNPYYNGFLRVYVPPDARLVRHRPDQGDEGAASDGPYRVFAQLLDVNPRGEQTVSFDYDLPARIVPDGQYNLTWLRQVGTSGDDLAAHIGHRTYIVPSTGRLMRATTSFRGNAVVEFLKHRWIVRKLGLGS